MRQLNITGKKHWNKWVNYKMDWYEELEFEEDPFSIDPRENHENLVEMQEVIDEIKYRISASSMLVIEGQLGTGKTTSLMVAANKFGGKKNVVYLDCQILEKNLNITHVLQDRFGVVGRMLNKKPHDMIVLMDNVHELSKQNTERLKYYFDQNYIKSIIFTTKSYRSAKFSQSLRDRIGNRVIKLPKLSDDDAVEVIRNRIGDIELFNDKLIKKIYKMSKGSIKQLLENCKQASINAVNKERRRVQLVDLKFLLRD
jgi:type II secretory pathway predicted ATPase ExeA